MKAKAITGGAVLRLATIVVLLVALVVPAAFAGTVRSRCEEELQGTASISGTAVDAETQASVEGIAVTADRIYDGVVSRAGMSASNEEWRNYSKDTVTAADGTYKLDKLPAGTYELTFEGGYYGATQWSNEASGTSTVTVKDGQVVEGIDAALEASRGGIVGVATLDGVPQDRVRVTAYALIEGEWDEVDSVKTGEDGVYRLFVEPGTYRLGFENECGEVLTNGSDWAPAIAPSFYPSASDIESAADITVAISQDVTADEALSANPDAVTIAGTVKNANGDPVAGAVVTPYFLGESGYWKPVKCVKAVSAADGSYSLRLLAGTFRLKCWPNNAELAFAFYPGASTVGAASDVTVAGGSSAAADFSLDAGSTITGTLTDQLGQGPKHSKVFCFSVFQLVDSEWVPVAGYTSQTSAYTLGSLPAGTYRLRFGYGGAKWLQPFFYKQAKTLADAQDIAVAEGSSVALDPSVFLGQAPSAVSGGCNHPKAKRGSRVKLSVKVVSGSKPIRSARVNVYRSNAKRWTWVGASSTNSSGYAALSTKVSRTVTFKFVFKGKGRVAGSSDLVKVTVR